MSDYNSFRDVVQMLDEPLTPNNPEREPEKPKRYTTILLSDLCELQKKAAERDRLVAWVAENLHFGDLHLAATWLESVQAVRSASEVQK